MTTPATGSRIKRTQALSRAFFLSPPHLAGVLPFTPSRGYLVASSQPDLFPSTLSPVSPLRGGSFSPPIGGRAAGGRAGNGTSNTVTLCHGWHKTPSQPQKCTKLVQASHAD